MRPDVRMIRWVMNITVREHKTTQVVQLAGVDGIEVKLTDGGRGRPNNIRKESINKATEWRG